jgi:hypothetical protein
MAIHRSPFHFRSREKSREEKIQGGQTTRQGQDEKYEIGRAIQGSTSFIVRGGEIDFGTVGGEFGLFGGFEV